MLYGTTCELVLWILAFVWTIENSLSVLQCEAGVSLEDENDVEGIILKIDDVEEDFTSCDTKDELRCRLNAIYEILEWSTIGNLTYGNFDEIANALCESAHDLGYEDIYNKEIRTMYRLCSKDWQKTHHVMPRKLCCYNGTNVPCKKDKRIVPLSSLRNGSTRHGDSISETIKCETGAFLEDELGTTRFLIKFTSLSEDFTECVESQELLCKQLAKQKVKRATDNGNYSLLIDEKEGYTFGDVLCDKAEDDIQEDVRHHAVCIYYRFCDKEWQRTNYQFPQKLCCEDGLQLPCDAQQKPLVSDYFWFK